MDLPVIATYETRTGEDMEAAWVRVIGWRGEELAFGTLSRTVVVEPSGRQRVYPGWRMLGYTDEGVLLGFRVLKGSPFEIADVETGRVGFTIPNGWWARLSPDGGWLAVKTIIERMPSYHLVDVATAEIVATAPALGRRQEDLVAVARDGLFVIVGETNFDANLAMMPMRQHGPMRWLADSSDLFGVELSDDGERIALAHMRRIVIGPAKLDDVTIDLELQTERRYTRPMAFHPTRPLLATNGEGLEVWDLQDRRVIARASPDQINLVRFSPDGRVLACARYDATLTLYALR